MKWQAGREVEPIFVSVVDLTSPDQVLLVATSNFSTRLISQDTKILKSLFIKLI